MDVEPIRILVLDDDPFIGKMLATMLAGYNVKNTTSFGQFQQVIEEFNPDIAIIDLHLPDAHGLDVCKWIRSQNQYEDVILYILTATNDEQTLIRAYSIGVMDYIIKPFNKFILFSKLRRCALMIEIKRKLEHSLEYQKDIKKRLLQLNDFIKKCIKIDDIDTLVALFLHIKYIIPLDGLFIFNKLTTGKYTVLKLISHESWQSLIPKLHKVIGQNTIEPVSFFFESTTKVYIASISLQRYGYVFFVSNLPYTPDERNLIGLLAEIIRVIISRTEIYEYVQKQNKIYRDEISKVRQIQVAQLPKFRNINGYEIASTFLPAEDISGDFFDGFYVDKDVFQIVLCDVSGHGIASSYIGNAMRTLIRTFSFNEQSPAKVLYKVNRQMIADGKGLYYFGTAVICRLYPDGTILYTSAGHPPLYYYNYNAHKIEELPNTGGLLGVFEDMAYQDATIMLQSGDMLFLYTDGLTESMNPALKTLYGDQRLKDTIFINAHENPVELLHSICGSMYEFTEYAPLEDDVTLICIKKI
ncbi:MAG TPA: SpoIIE family protein phosphatase [Spirochaetota bacterium]|nr:SpoIIE family protein phosphatase [Spirochaetota bacterium]HOM08595.1 SpoIIE family protein phosphatase [Spirochaetota bacterium]HPP48414.1 SpoIIE family protein phosphatase [Spirochaetota bacterium]